MAWFTVELWKVLEIEQDTGDGHKIGLGAYPIPTSWDEAARNALNKKIIDHYWNREIGQETISMFELAVARRMNEIMPMYVQLYDSCRITFDPLSTINITTIRDDDTTENVTRGSTSNADSTSDGKSRTVTSSPPQNQLSAAGQYATNIVDANSSGTSTNTAASTDTTTGDAKLTGSSTSTGYQGSAADLLNKFRTTILNIDLMVILDLEDCFMGVWDNSQELLPERGSYY